MRLSAALGWRSSGNRSKCRAIEYPAWLLPLMVELRGSTNFLTKVDLMRLERFL